MITISTFGTTKRKPLLDYNGHSYVKDRSTTEKIYWRCSRYSTQHCRSRLHTCILTNNIVKPPTEHSCTFDGTTLELRKFDQQLIDRAKSTQEAPDMIVTNCIKGMSDQAVSRLPIRDNIKRRIRKIRSKNDYTAVPNDPNFLSIPSALCKTQRNSQFLRSDTGPGDDRILIFASDEQLGILQSAHHFMSDGTFKVVPEEFYQLYIIHAVYRDHVTPVCYALLRRKDASTYERLFNEILKFAPEWTPESMLIDYEKACINAYQSVFPDALLSGCYFHLKQNLHRKLQVCMTYYKY
ncbi:unnamed protein product [Rotaria sordida]|uniref:MULE transposase domain-containing protein n=1 Tax=Rotaria sordida TaxID=392033 RepID=A0A814NNY5_9BILA|nr:unnamed protein product [Rotaria sordida]